MTTLFPCGDVMAGRGIEQVLPHPGDPQLHEPYVKSAADYVDLAQRAHGPFPRRAARVRVERCARGWRRTRASLIEAVSRKTNIAIESLFKPFIDTAVGAGLSSDASSDLNIHKILNRIIDRDQRAWVVASYIAKGRSLERSNFRS